MRKALAKTEEKQEGKGTNETLKSQASQPPPPPTSFSSPIPNPYNKQQMLVILLLVISVFVNGALWTKLQYYEKGGTPTGATAQGATKPATSALSADNLKKYAKDVKLDSNKFNACLDQNKFKDVVSQESQTATTLGISGTPGFLINGKLLGGAYPIDAFKEIIDKEIAGTGSTDYKTYSAMLQQSYESANRSFDPNPKPVEIGSSPAKGNSNAPVTIIEFSDFECPYCSRFYSQTLPQLQKDYIDTGKAKLVYKQLPLTSIHPNAQAAAEASLCANEQGKFWEYHDKLFASMAQGS